MVVSSRVTARRLFGALSLCLVLCAVVGVVGCAAGPSAPAAGQEPPQRVEVRFENGAVQGGVHRVPVGLGRMVVLAVSSDVADEVHLHGFDRKVDVPAGGSASLQFVADRAGVFEAELESRGAQLVQLEIR